MADEVLVASSDHTCIVTLNRPHKRNALNTSMIAQLRGTLERVSADPDVRVIIVRASGPAFCAGLDLREMAAQREAGEAPPRAPAKRLRGPPGRAPPPPPPPPRHP